MKEYVYISQIKFQCNDDIEAREIIAFINTHHEYIPDKYIPEEVKSAVKTCKLQEIFSDKKPRKVELIPNLKEKTSADNNRNNEKNEHH